MDRIIVQAKDLKHFADGLAKRRVFEIVFSEIATYCNCGFMLIGSEETVDIKFNIRGNARDIR